MPTDDVIDRRIRRAICKILWNIARGERPGTPVRFRGGQLAAVDKAAVELMEMYEVAADQVIAELYEDWTKANTWADPSEEHFAWLMAGESLGMVREAIFENLCNGRIPQFSIELRGDELAWTGDLAAGEGAMGVIAAKVVKRNPLIPSEEDYLGETLGAPNPAHPHEGGPCQANPGGKHWYVFYTPFGRAVPKEYQGPFTLESSARTAMAQDLKKYSASADGYQIKHLTEDGFVKIWGAKPRPNPAHPAGPCGMCGKPTVMRYPGNEPENGPARPYCPDGHSTCYGCGKWFKAKYKKYERDACPTCEEASNADLEAMERNPTKVSRSISSFADGLRDIGADGVEMLWRAIGVADKDGMPIGTFKKVVDERTVAVKLPDGSIQNYPSASVYPYEMRRNPPAAWRRQELGKGYRAPDEVGDVGNYRTVVYPKGGVYADEMRGSMTRLIEQGDPFQRGSIAPPDRHGHPFPIKQDKERLITRGTGKPPWLPNPGSSTFFIGHRDGGDVEIDAEHGQFKTREAALDVARKMDAQTRRRSVIVGHGPVVIDGEHVSTDVTLYSIATGELLLRENPHWAHSEIQSLLFDKHKFSEAQAKHWADVHGFRFGKVDTTAHYHRLRQHEPTGGPCRTIEFGHEGVKAILCSSEKPKGKPPWLPNPGDTWIDERVIVTFEGKDRAGLVVGANPPSGSDAMLEVKFDDDPRGRVSHVLARYAALERLAMVGLSREPTMDELAKAYGYIEAEYRSVDAIDGEMWAEALAFIASHPGHKYVDPDDRRLMIEMYPQLSPRQWRQITTRADHILKIEGDRPRFTV